MQDDQKSDISIGSESNIGSESGIGSESSVEPESGVEPEPEAGPLPEPALIDPGTSDPVSDDRAFQTLDRQVIRVWRVVGTISFGVICLAVVIGSFLLWTLTPVPKFVFPLAWLITGGLVYVNVVWLPPREYDRWSYRIDERILELRYGIVWRVSVLIPLSRLQHVDLHRGPIERNYGLTTLEIHTAGTRDASHKLPGLHAETAVRLRDELIQAANLNVE